MQRGLRDAGLGGNLAEAAEQLQFPQPEHPYSYLIAARLHAFSDSERWALIVDTVGYNQRAANVVDVPHGLGNCLIRTTENWAARFLNRIDNFQDLFEDEPESLRFRQIPIMIRGKAVSVDAAAVTPPQDLFRLLAPDHRDLLLADETELGRLVPADLPEVLRLDDWHHAALRVQRPGPERERQRRLHEMLARHTPPDKHVPFEVRPSDSETYRQIAEVLATAYRSHHRPARPGNTHWSNWPMSGAL